MLRLMLLMMKHFALISLTLFTFASVAFSDVAITVDQISDNRTTTGFFKGLELVLKLKGPELAEAKGMSISLTEAKDDTGKDISKIEHFGFDTGGFDPLEKKFGRDTKADEFEHKLKLPNPARAAKTVKITGSLNLLVPSKDPSSVIAVNPAKEAGKPLVNPVLQAAGAEITFQAPKGSQASYKINDPKGIVAAVEFCSADGKVLETSGRSSMSFGSGKSISIDLKAAASADLVAKIYLGTPKSVLSVPLKFEAIALP